MTPKEKANDLVHKFFYADYTDITINEAKQCALIAVDEILNDDWYIASLEDLIARKKYWQEVKQEINKL